MCLTLLLLIWFHTGSRSENFYIGEQDIKYPFWNLFFKGGLDLEVRSSCHMRCVAVATKDNSAFHPLSAMPVVTCPYPDRTESGLSLSPHVIIGCHLWTRKPATPWHRDMNKLSQAFYGEREELNAHLWFTWNARLLLGCVVLAWAYLSFSGPKCRNGSFCFHLKHSELEFVFKKCLSFSVLRNADRSTRKEQPVHRDPVILSFYLPGFWLLEQGVQEVIIY